MDGDELHERVRSRVEELPGSRWEQPFGEGTWVAKVGEKMFLLLATLRREPIVNVKATPADVTQLVEAYAEITPGYHMNKRHWVTLSRGPGLTADLVDELVTESYLLVLAGLPRSRRPVDPETFAAQSQAELRARRRP